MTEGNNGIAGIVRRIYEEILNEGQLGVAHEVIAPDGIDRAPTHVSRKGSPT